MEIQQNYAEMNVSAEIDFRFQGFFTKLKRQKVRADSILVKFVRISTRIRVGSEDADLVNSHMGRIYLKDPGGPPQTGGFQC